MFQNSPEFIAEQEKLIFFKTKLHLCGNEHINQIPKLLNHLYLRLNKILLPNKNFLLTMYNDKKFFCTNKKYYKSIQQQIFIRELALEFFLT